MERRELIRRGNIITTKYIEAAETGCYIGNGRFGAVMGGLGLNMSPALQKKLPTMGQSQYMHMGHWGRFKFHSDAMEKETSADYILPLLKLHWETEPEQVINYSQCQDFYDGILETSYELESGVQISVCNWFDMANKNLAGIYIDVCRNDAKDEAVSIKATAITDFIPYAFLYRELTHQNIEIKQKSDNWCITITCENTVNNSKSSLYFYSSAPVEVCPDGLRFLLSEGRNQLFMSYGKPINKEETALSLNRTKGKWHKIWEDSGWFDFPEDTTQKIWVRSLAYLLSSYDDDYGIIQPTNGLTGNMFPFHFVQDMEYMAPALMMTGHVDIVKRWVEKFTGEIPAMQRYAKHLWPQAEGIYPPWELPYGSIEGYHSPSVPVIYCYEPHNAGYLCRLAKEAADVVGDDEWTVKYVYPLVREVCQFYKSFCQKGEDGLWHLKWEPCIGQDEAGGRNKQDYLCSLYSAEYSFKTAFEYGLDQDGSCKQILEEGLAFRNLLSDRGTLHTAQGADDFGRQKHPVQLDGLAYFPIEKEPLSYERKAYEVRHEITDRAHEPFYFGWTLGQFLLSGSNLKDAEGWRHDWAQIRSSNYMDTDWVQIYETSGEAEKSFYMTTHGMIMQSLIRNYVNDYWGKLDIASCPVFHGRVSFGNIVTRLGVVVSGESDEKEIDVELKAQRDCTFVLSGNTYSMQKGETRHWHMNISLE